MPAGTVHRFTGPFPLLSHFFKEGRPEFILLSRNQDNEDLGNPFVVCCCPIAKSRRIAENLGMRAFGAASQWWGTIVIIKFVDHLYSRFEDIIDNDVFLLRGLLRGSQT